LPSAAPRPPAGHLRRQGHQPCHLQRLAHLRAICGDRDTSPAICSVSPTRERRSAPLALEKRLRGRRSAPLALEKRFRERRSPDFEPENASSSLDRESFEVRNASSSLDRPSFRVRNASASDNLDIFRARTRLRATISRSVRSAAALRASISRLFRGARVRERRSRDRFGLRPLDEPRSEVSLGIAARRAPLVRRLPALAWRT
jgi:hypothetical protein